MKQADEHREEVGKRCTCGGGYDPDCPVDHGALPYHERLPVWVAFPLESFDADDGTIDEDGALQWLRENELAAWPESFVRAPCRVKMTNGETNMLMSGTDVLVSAALACLLEDTGHGRHWLRENGLKDWPLHWYQDADGEWKA